ncbi:hypothetical protein C7374_102210 [Falsochrobactrum ovis]|uniref:Uncharacterized protein n=1 Tax=Falsochrobactrum ovis TaxID=1293442 RepID=A0A364JXS7_9HYPH|nr:hypothetical protein C7374_102210 [Falsochrobactrum ovis]
MNSTQWIRLFDNFASLAVAASFLMTKSFTLTYLVEPLAQCSGKIHSVEAYGVSKGKRVNLKPGRNILPGLFVIFVMRFLLLRLSEHLCDAATNRPIRAGLGLR